MTPIYTFGGQPARRNLTLLDLRHAKAEGRKLTQANATRDIAEEAAAVAAAGIDILSVTSLRYDEARAAAPDQYIIATIGAPHLVTPDEVLREAFRVATAGADCIYTIRSLKIIEMLAREGLSIQGHAGLVPRKSIATGGLRAMGRTADEALSILHDVRRLEDAGAVAVELECVAKEAAAAITARTPLITHGIGSGQNTDVIFLFTADICGDTPALPRHAKPFGDLKPLRVALDTERRRALSSYAKAVRAHSFPDHATTATMPPEEHAKLAEALDRLRPLHEVPMIDQDRDAASPPPCHPTCQPASPQPPTASTRCTDNP
ncbi:MAG: 3-methyl-2-oxobutanoate hydroxymethyltransferase [Tabrizicola sp.]|uniref:3-methyl-2-oxobutanoate hydroxymethyltransferase n=1 Tax=Tabrizicola sp. TaxID=2005166 RepID=UPI002736199D|nr:3-methyl-2-oxobutanoate hydroxymethyltransferase [Tabrizicola sp.]MDP3262012.1 3-methyl-2-oxobutanoate hydroxymethyltransferase [Tabrizicola sp.]